MAELEYFVGTLSACESFIRKMNTMMGYPNPETKTERYSIPREHATKKGTWFVPLKAVIPPKFTAQPTLHILEVHIKTTKLKKKTTLNTLKAEGAFPIPMEN